MINEHQWYIIIIIISCLALWRKQGLPILDLLPFFHFTGHRHLRDLTERDPFTDTLLVSTFLVVAVGMSNEHFFAL